MASPPLIKFFTVFGIFLFKFNQNSNRYEKSSRILYYAIVITITIQTFSVFSFYYRMYYIREYILEVTYLSFTEKVLLWLDSILWIILNGSVVFPVICKRNDFCQVLNWILHVDGIFKTYYNDLTSHMNKSYKNRFEIIYKSFLFVYIVGVPVNVLFIHGVNNTVFFLLISHYILVCQFLFGHVYELMLVERSVSDFQLLQSTLSSNQSVEVVKFCLAMHSKCQKLSKRTFKLFQWSKVMCLASVLIIMSFYWFFKFERLLNGSIMRQ